MKMNVANYVKDQTRICQQFLGYKFDFCYFDASAAFHQFPITRAILTVHNLTTTNVEINKINSNDVNVARHLELHV